MKKKTKILADDAKMEASAALLLSYVCVLLCNLSFFFLHHLFFYNLRCLLLFHLDVLRKKKRKSLFVFLFIHHLLNVFFGVALFFCFEIYSLRKPSKLRNFISRSGKYGSRSVRVYHVGSVVKLKINQGEGFFYFSSRIYSFSCFSLWNPLVLERASITNEQKK